MSNLYLWESINFSLEDVIQQLKALLERSDFATKMHLAFGEKFNLAEAQSLILNLVNEQQLPELEIVEATTINGGNGAYDYLNNKIYLSQEFLTQNINHPQVITNLLLEEIGHYLDAQLNDTDTPGDEGAIFAAIAQGQELSSSALATLQAEDDNTTVVINGQEITVELNATFGNITLDGNLADWTSNYRLDFLPGTEQPGYELYGKLAGDAYVFALKSDGTEIASNTTFWLNTDQDTSTGYQIFGFAGGAEYNVNFFTDNQPYLYTGAAGENFVAGALDHAYNNSQQIIEFAVPVSLLNTSATEINVLADINNQVFLPGDYSNQFTVSATGNNLAVVPEATTYGEINLDGDLSDWTPAARLDSFLGSGQPGYEVYGKLAGDAYVFAIKSDGTAIGAETTVWLNTDQDTSTGHQIFGFAGGAEYNVNFFTDNQPYLYTGAAGENLVAGKLNHAYGNGGQVVEFAVDRALLENNPQAIDVLIDVNNQVFLPGDYSNAKYTIDTNENLPVRTDFSKKVGIVFSQTTADQFFGLADLAANQTAYSQLFMSVQEEVMMSGVPFDLLTEDDLKDINNLVNYDTLIFPSIRNVKQADVQQIQDTLTDAVYEYNIGIIAAGDFMTNSETGDLLAGDPYYRMKTLLGLQPQAFGSGKVSLTAQDVTQAAMQGYEAGEVIREYQNPIGYAAYQSYENETIDVLVNQTVDGQTYNAVVATETGGGNVHFATTSYLGDNNLAWEAIRWSTFDNQPSVALSMTRNESLFLSRNDMDQSAEFFEVNPEDGSAGIYDQLLPILAQWKTDFNFVGSYYINIGNSPEQGEYTDWTLSKPYYDALIAAGNEIGSHSYTHLEEGDYNPPNDTNVATPAQIEFEFNQSKLVIEQELGIEVTGAAVPGAPEQLPTSEEIIQYFDYLSGGATFVGAGYPGAFGFLTPDQESVYFAPNLWFDFTLIGFGIPVPDGNGGFVPQPLSAEEAQVEWIRQFNEVTSHSNKPIVLMPWHDYGPTNYNDDGYNQEMFTALIREAYNSGAEFVTLDDASQRIQAFEQSKLFIESSGNTITAEVIATNVDNFGLDISGNQIIKSVDNWYAYDENTVFLPTNGGQFTINLGNVQDRVTRIVELPMRAKLETVTGNAIDLAYTFFGEGQVVVEVANPGQVSVIGADRVSLNGNTVEMIFDRINRHNACILAATTENDLIEGATGQDILVGGQGNDILYGERVIGAPVTIFATDFEAAPDNNSGFIAAPLDGWSSTDGTIEYKVGDSAVGNNHIELNADPINFYPDARQIYRDINTEAGKFYELTFQSAPRPGYDADVNAIAFKLDGNTLLNVAEDGSANSSNLWTTYTVSFTGNGSSQRLEFISIGTPVNYGRGGYLDDIKLLAYEEDPTLDGDDILNGGLGNDIMTGGRGNDIFVFPKNDSLLAGELDIIKDFEVGKDKVEFQGWSNIDAASWFSGIVSQGLITNTFDGALLSSNLNNGSGQILFEGVSVEKLDAADFSFV